MQDLDDDPRVGPRRLAAVPGAPETPSVTEPEASVVPAHRLLDTAGTLVEGATRFHAQLQHLDAGERDVILDLVAEQMMELVRSWTDLVRTMVPGEAAGTQTARAAKGGTSRATTSAEAAAPGHTRSFDTAARGGAGRADHPARVGRDPAAFHHDEMDADTELEVSDDGGAARATDLAPTRRGAPMTPVPGSTPRSRSGYAERRDAGRDDRDELTGVLHRNAGMAALGREIDRCRRGGERFVLGYLNVDGMTQVNDTRGLRAGDEVLRKVTAALRATLRSYDVIARLGGDEFLFSVPGADAETAELRFTEFSIILAEDAPGTTASVGFAELHLHDTLDELVTEAETAMLKRRRTRRRGRG